MFNSDLKNKIKELEHKIEYQDMRIVTIQRDIGKLYAKDTEQLERFNMLLNVLELKLETGERIVNEL